MRTSTGRSSLVRLFAYIRGKTIHFTLSVILIVLMAYTSGVIPVLIRDAVDHGVVTGDTRRAVEYGLLILAVAILNGVFSFTGRYLLTDASQHAVYKLRVEAFRAIQRQSLEFFDRTMVGQLISRITNDAERVTGFLSFRLRMLVYSTFLIGVSLYYMAGMSGILTGVALATIMASMAINAAYARRVRPVYDQIRHQTGVLAAESTASISGIKTVKALGLEPYVLGRFDRENFELLGLNLEAARITALYGNAPFMVMGMAMAAMLYYGGLGIVAGTLSVGELVAFLTYMLTMMWPLRALGFIIGDIQRSLAAANRLFSIIDLKPTVSVSRDAFNLESVEGEIVFDNVEFTYDGGTRVLDGVNFRVRPGETVLITGPPGAGKTTILKLLLRLYEPSRGRILIDGVDIGRVSLESLRRHIALVPQEPFIFNRSIYENILIGKPDASRDEVERAARRARIHEFVISLPMGYQTLVGEKGVTLSGGQRQRIALARALLSDAKIILLDDPVSNLDAKTEEELLDDLQVMLREKTALIVSQRPTLARIADRILVVKDGKVVEEGTHEELMRRRGVYYRMYLEAVEELAKREIDVAPTA